MTLASTGSQGGRRRTLALSAVAGLVAVPLLLTAWNVSTALTQGAANTELRRMLDSLEDRQEAPDADAAAKGDQMERSFLKGETVGMAGAALQAEVAAIVESVQANTVETELLDPEDGEDPKDLRLRITFEAKNDALQRILLAVEGSATALYLRNLTIEPSNSRDGDSDSERSEPVLRATAVIEGYWGEGRQ